MQMCDCGEQCDDEGDGPFCPKCEDIYCPDCGLELENKYCPDCDPEGYVEDMLDDQEWMDEITADRWPIESWSGEGWEEVL